MEVVIRQALRVEFVRRPQLPLQEPPTELARRNGVVLLLEGEKDRQMAAAPRCHDLEVGVYPAYDDDDRPHRGADRANRIPHAGPTPSGRNIGRSGTAYVHQ